MAIQTVCLACGGKTEVGDDHLGRVLPCPLCGASMTVEPFTPPAIAAGAGPTVPSDSPPPNWVAPTIVAAVGVPLVITLLAFILLYGGSASSIRRQVAIVESKTVQIGNSTYPLHRLFVKVQNNSEHSISRLFVHGSVKSRERSVPWAEAWVSCQVPGGLAPGEAHIWEIPLGSSMGPVQACEISAERELKLEIWDLDWTGRHAGYDYSDWEHRIEVIASGPAEICPPFAETVQNYCRRNPIDLEREAEAFRRRN